MTSCLLVKTTRGFLVSSFYPYQQKAITAALNFLTKFPIDHHLCVELPTGAGKSYVGAGICDRAARQDKRVLMLVPRQELVRQNGDALAAVNPDLDVGVCCAGLDSFDTDNQIIIGTIQTVGKRLDAIGVVDLVLIDESHLVAEKNKDGYYTKLIETMEAAHPQLRVLGMTASPYRVGQGMLTDGDHATFTHIIRASEFGAGIKQLQDMGKLCRFSTEEVANHYSTDGMKKRMGDFTATSLNDMVDAQRLTTELACQEIVAMTAQRKAGLVFCVNIEHALEVQRQLPGAYIITGKTPSVERDEIIDEFRAGKIKYLVNVDVLTTGFDATNVDFLAFLRPTSSPGLWVQMCGRGLRVNPDKTDCLLLDFAGNIERLGLPEDVEPPKKRGKGNGDPILRTCPNCSALCYSGQRNCHECGHVFEREIKLTTAAMIKPKKAEKMAVKPTKFTVRLHTKTGKPPSFAITFYTGIMPVTTHYLCVYHKGYAGDMARQHWNRWVDPAIKPERLTASENLAIIEQRLQMPAELIVRSDKYNTIERWVR